MNGWKVNNLPENVNGYVVATMVDDELWFYGCYATEKKALEISEMDSDFVFVGKA